VKALFGDFFLSESVCKSFQTERKQCSCTKVVCNQQR
jgi:hypothetical protein